MPGNKNVGKKKTGGLCGTEELCYGTWPRQWRLERLSCLAIPPSPFRLLFPTSPFISDIYAASPFRLSGVKAKGEAVFVPTTQIRLLFPTFGLGLVLRIVRFFALCFVLCFDGRWSWLRDFLFSCFCF